MDEASGWIEELQEYQKGNKDPINKIFKEYSESFSQVDGLVGWKEGKKYKRTLCRVCHKDISKYVLDTYGFDILGTDLCNQCRNAHVNCAELCTHG